MLGLLELDAAPNETRFVDHFLELYEAISSNRETAS